MGHSMRLVGPRVRNAHGRFCSLTKDRKSGVAADEVGRPAEWGAGTCGPLPGQSLKDREMFDLLGFG